MPQLLQFLALGLDLCVKGPQLRQDGGEELHVVGRGDRQGNGLCAGAWHYL